MAGAPLVRATLRGRAGEHRRGAGAAIAATFATTLAATLATVGVSSAAPAPAEPVLYAQRGALYLYEDKAAQKLADLPAELGKAISLQTDPAAKVALVGSDVRWYWTPLRDDAGALGAISFRKLPCAAGRARLAPDGSAVLCGAPTGASLVVSLPSGKSVAAPSPLEQTALVLAPPAPPATAPELRLVWSDARGVWTAPVANPKAARQVAPEAPLSGFSVSPTGERALGVFTGAAHHGKNVTQQPMLYGFALDGRAVRRKAIQRALPLLWSADARWVLVQDNESACIMAATGGQYKCWKGYRGVSLSRDGRFALLLGNRSEKEKEERGSREAKKSKDKKGKDKKGDRNGDRNGDRKDDKTVAAKEPEAARPSDEPKPSIELTRLSKATHANGPGAASGSAPGAHTDIDTLIDSIESYDDESDEPEPTSDLGEGGEGEGGGPADSGPASSLTGELHLYRASLEGAFTTAPVQLAPSVDGAATFCGPLR